MNPHRPPAAAYEQNGMHQSGLKVLFQARPSIFRARGGDTIQLEGTRKYLLALGVTVDFDSSDTVDCTPYDLIHLFNITHPEETWLQLQNAQRQGKPVCLSTIYWSEDGVRSEIHTRQSWRQSLDEHLRTMAKGALALTSERYGVYWRAARLRAKGGLRELQSDLLRGADVLLPNAHLELEQLRRDFPFTVTKPARVVHNGIDCEVFGKPVSDRSWGTNHGLGVFVLCAARIERRKNQLRLVNALKDSDTPVVLIGRAADPEYAVEVRRAMKASDLWIDEVEQEELRQAYAAACVHVLPSFFDTPGLVSLEAAAMGCNIVTSQLGSQFEYFGDRADYCDPYDEGTIRTAILKALNRPWPNHSLRQHILTNYTWEIAARQTLDAYETALYMAQRVR